MTTTLPGDWADDDSEDEDFGIVHPDAEEWEAARRKAADPGTGRAEATAPDGPGTGAPDLELEADGPALEPANGIPSSASPGAVERVANGDSSKLRDPASGGAGPAQGSADVPLRIGRFRIVEHLRREEGHDVYRGYDPESGQRADVTVWSRQSGQDPSRRRYRRRLLETQFAVSAQIDHPGILKVLEIPDGDDAWFVATEAFDGARVLSDLWHPHVLLPVRRALAIACACATTLDHAHRRGVVHCDVQPTNILVADNDETRVAGFGRALLQGEGEIENTILSPAGAAIYVAPEQLLEGDISPQVDVFSLGVVLYELLTGVHPFASRVIPEIAQKITGRAHVPATQRRADLPPVLDRILDRALKKHPAGRYQSAAALAGDLALVLDELSPRPELEPDETQLQWILGLPFFREFDRKQVLEVLGVSVWHRFEPGHTIVREGEPGLSFFIIVLGETEVYKDDKLIDVLHRGDCFGEIGFVTRRDRSASVTARGFVMALEIRARLVDRIPSGSRNLFQRAFLDTMADRLVRATQRVVELSVELERVREGR